MFAAALAARSADEVIVAAELSPSDEAAYADEPYWYRPGHPVNPAEAAAIEALPGFAAERVLRVPEELGSWTALTAMNDGSLLAVAQHGPGIFRIRPAPIGDENARTLVEPLGGAAAGIGWAHGILHAFDSLYVTVTEPNENVDAGIYRLRDTDGDGVFDRSDQMLELNAGGEHGPHQIVADEEEGNLYLICGNGTPLPDSLAVRRPVATDGIDHLMPPGFESSRHTAAGWVARCRPDGSDWQVIASGLRNAYDLALSENGDLFTFDSDMEWDLGTPWYRPTRICHLVSGAEFGWRGDAAKWPEHFDDSVAPVVNIGPASPTGITFGYGAKFPAKYQGALFACDWTFATIHAVHLIPDGGSWRAEAEEFVGGTGLPVTDAVIGADGAMYFVVGGRRLRSAVYRIHYVGNDSTRPAPTSPPPGTLHNLRSSLEAFHGRRHPEAVDAAWPHIGHPDRAVRFAARVAVESQVVDEWNSRALLPSGSLDRDLGALLALARQGDGESLRSVTARLADLPWSSLSDRQLLRGLRTAEVALARIDEGSDSPARDAVRRTLRSLLPHPDRLVARELSRMLCFLRDRSSIDPILDLMQSDDGGRPPLGSGYFVRNPKYGAAVRDMLESAPLLERMHHAQMLLWIDDGWSRSQLERYFTLIAEAMANSKGGHQYREFWDRIRETKLQQVDPAMRESLESIRPPAVTIAAGDAPQPKGPGRPWTVEDALDAVAGSLHDADLDHGRQMFLAAGCAVCHRLDGEGGAAGPDLTTLGQRFTLRDILDASINPSSAIADQYQIASLELHDGSFVAGRIVSQDADSIRIATNLMQPAESTAVPAASVKHLRRQPVSTMPTGLLDRLNPQELRDLVAFLVRRPDRPAAETGCQ